MHPKSVIFTMIACSLAACHWGVPGKIKPAITEDTLKYTYKIIKKSAADCDNKPDSACIVAKIKYPVFTGQKILNDTISHHLLMQFGIADKADNLEQLAEQFLKAGKDFSLNSSTEVIRQDSSILVMQFSGYRLIGGARGYPLIDFINWNTKAEKKIELKDIFAEGNTAGLNIIAEKIFRKQEKLSDSASLKPAYLFEGGRFTLNNNFLITPIGIRFLYNQYEIKSYPAAQTDILIPYSQIRSLLRPNTVVTQYLN
ncbi:MAG: hypothetical protein JWP78_579 [Mucilaginibacter sp.]|nr:hypothetical protein [Mucilaginibacter sp.]